MTPQDKAVAAAWIDGEGCIYIARMNRYGQRQSPHHLLGLNVGNTDRRICDWFQDRFGGKVYLKRQSGNRKPFWQWMLYGDAAADVLRATLPYFIIKREQADVALEFAATRAPQKHCRVRLDDAVVKHRETLKLRLSALKHGEHHATVKPKGREVPFVPDPVPVGSRKARSRR